MPRTASILLLYLFAVIFASCSKPKSKIIPLDMNSWDSELFPLMESLTESEKIFLKGYLQRMAPEGLKGKNYIPPGTTIGDAIADQRSYDEKQHPYWKLKTWEEVEAQPAFREQSAQELLGVLHEWDDHVKIKAALTGKWDDPAFRLSHQKRCSAIERALISGTISSSPTPSSVSPEKSEAPENKPPPNQNTTAGAEEQSP
jgi:hypothetical protein